MGLGLDRSGNPRNLTQGFSMYRMGTDPKLVQRPVCVSGHIHCAPDQTHLGDNLAAPPTAPLCTYYANDNPYYVTSSDITSTLQASVRVVGPNLGFLPKEVRARCLCVAGAMALLCTHVDSDTILLLGRWRSDVMLHYLTVHAQFFMWDFSRHILDGGDYLFSLTKMSPKSKRKYKLQPIHWISSLSFPTHPAILLAITYYLSTE
jgi:hypothetical protein